MALRTAALTLSMAVLCGGLGGCASLRYLGQAAHGQWQLVRARRPITRLITAPDTDPVLRARLELVQDARDFSVRELGLPDNRSYRTYADLKRPYVVWNVVAAPEFSVTPLHWCFPFTGCITYRGYFHEDAAQAFAAQLAQAGNDTLVAGVTAYSTLGHFADPVLNTMMRYGDLDLIATMFHELAHQLVYVRGDSEFNESFAMSVEQEGLARWLNARGRSSELAGYLVRRQQQQTLVGVFARGRAQLDELYRQPLPEAERRAAKTVRMAAISRDVKQLETQYQVHTGYDAWIDAGLNNAHLASVATYFDCIPSFERLLTQQGGSLPQFYAAVRQLARAKPARRREFCSAPPQG
jgi:predicted aminopeptidase